MSPGYKGAALPGITVLCRKPVSARNLGVFLGKVDYNCGKSVKGSVSIGYCSQGALTPLGHS